MILPSGPKRDTNTSLILLLFPFGMFCKFGLLDENRAVTVLVWLMLWWMMPCSSTRDSMPLVSPVFSSVTMKYVPRSLVAAAKALRAFRNGMPRFPSSSITSLEVDHTPGVSPAHAFLGSVMRGKTYG